MINKEKVAKFNNKDVYQYNLKNIKALLIAEIFVCE